MPDPSFSDLPILGELGAALDAAMARAVAAEPTVAGAGATTAAAHAPAAPTSPTPAPPAIGDPGRPGGSTSAAHPRRWRRVSGRPLPTIVVALLLGGLGTSTAAATLTVLRGSPIPIPRAADVQPPMAPEAGTEQVVALRAPRPGGGDPFTLRVGRSETGLACVTVGQARGARFGVVGTDDAFRDLPSEIVDGCGKIAPNQPAVVGARTFDAPTYRDVRTAVYGIAGPDLRRAELQERGVWSPIQAHDGRFLRVVRGYPIDAALHVRLTYASGRTSVHDLGGAANIVTDPTGPAWSMEAGTTEGAGTLCLDVHHGVLGYAGLAHAEPVCGRVRGPKDARLAAPYVIAIRHFDRGDEGGPRVRSELPGEHWTWKGAPRTFAYGFVDHRRFTAIRVERTDGTVLRTVKTWAGNTFTVVLPGTIPAADVRVVLVGRDGTTVTIDHDVNVTPVRTTLPRSGGHR